MQRIATDNLANGISPIDEMPVDDNDIINNVSVLRWLFYHANYVLIDDRYEVNIDL